MSPPLSNGGFLRWLGLWFLMSMTHFDSWRDCWSTKTIDMFEGTQMRLGEYMLRTIFEAITSALRHKDKPSPTYKDGWEFRRLIYEWNANMDKKYTPAWVSYLDESMSKCLNEYTFPGVVCVPRNPWPFRNKYHTIACGLKRMLYRMDIVEGKDMLSQRPPK